MSEIFLKIINMSISASYIVLAVLLLRLLLKKAPKWIAVVLWGIVALRLVCPFTVESVLSLIPSSEVVAPDIMMDRKPEINTGIPIVNQVINPIISGSFTPDPATSANPLQLWIPTFALIWIVGMVALLIYTVISYARLKRKIGTAVLLRDNIYQSDNVVSPFVLGIIKPKIYLPFGMNEQDVAHVIAHEQAHVRRKDHWWKPLGFLLLTLHWFNPLMWLGYVLLCRDIELACDEKVIGELDRDSRADYSQALLSCSVNRRIIAACPLAFGEVGVKDRVKSVLSYKKPTFWIILAAVIVCIVAAVCFLTDPINDSIYAKRADSDTIELNIKYPFGSYGGYSVRYVPEDEGEYIGDGMVDYDGSLGKYRIMIKFGDIEPSEELYDYITEENGEIKNAPIKMRIKIAHPSDHGFVLYVGFDEKIYIDPVEYTKLNELGGTIKIKIKTNPPELSNDNSLRIQYLREQYPEYFALDASKGLDVYVWQMSKNSYYFGLLPHSEQERNWIDDELMNLRSTVAEDMCIILSTYNVDESNIYIIPWQNPISSYISEYYIIRDGEDPDAKKQAYVNHIRQMLFGNNSEGQEKCTLIYHSPGYSYVMSDVPTIVIENNVIYTVSDGGKIKLGAVEEIDLDTSNFDALFYQGGFDYSELANELRTNNEKAYEVKCTTWVHGIEIYYVMKQKSGETLIVYGHYENGERSNEIRWIYSISQ